MDASESFEYDRLFIYLWSFCFTAYLTFIGCCAPTVCFVAERERKSKRGETDLTQLLPVSKPGHFPLIKAENSLVKKKKRTEGTFSTCVLRSSLTLLFFYSEQLDLIRYKICT